MNDQGRESAENAANEEAAFYPSVFTDLDRDADRAQSRFLAVQRAELIGLLAAAVTLELGWIVDGVAVAPLIGAAALLMALTCRIVGRRLGFEETWITSRGAAETVKSLIWLHGATAPRDGAAGSADLRADIDTALRKYGLAAVNDGPIQGAIVDLHAADDDRRRETYLRQRIREQQRWYRGRAETNESKAKAWSRAVIGFEAGGVMMAVAQGLQWVDIGWAGILGAAAAAAVAWRQTKQFAALATTYRATADDVDELAIELATAPAERWNELVERSEDTLSREQKLWALRRSLA